MVTAPKKVVPGDQICKYDETCVLGSGLHVHQGVVYSTLLGKTMYNQQIVYSFKALLTMTHLLLKYFNTIAILSLRTYLILTILIPEN